jgi:hypothetical protein
MELSRFDRRNVLAAGWTAASFRRLGVCNVSEGGEFEKPDNERPPVCKAF